MKIVYFDCFAGISGDMTLGAFLDCGVSPETLRQELEKLGLPGFHLEIEKAKKRGITGTSCRVAADREEHCHRHFPEIQEMIESSSLDAPVKATALSMFGRVAKAEGKVHGVPPEKVHFHEVGAVDSIVDIVGAAILAELASPADGFPAMRIHRVGYGFGEREFEVLNALRVFIGGDEA